MSTIDPKKIAFKGTTNTDLQKHINTYFITLGGINPSGLGYTSPTFYYFIENSGKIIRASRLPTGYTEREPGDYFKDSLGGIKNERKFAFLGSKVKSFINSFVALVSGETDTVVDEKVWRQAESALASQIPALKGDLVALEDKVEEAKEFLAKARLNNGNLINKRESYVEGLLIAKNAVTLAEENLADHKEKIAFLESELKNLSEEEVK